MPSYTFLILLFLKYCLTQDFRVININEFQTEGSYLPVRGGQKFIIELDGNPTTGYSWFLENVEKLNNQLLIPLNLNDKNSADFYKKTPGPGEENEARKLGVGGIYHFKFHANEVNSGDEVLHFVYKRPWSTENEVRKTINIKVVNPHSTSDL